MADDDEILDLVNERDQVVGRISRGDVDSLTPGGGRYVRAADLFIVRSDGAIWVPVRALHKSIAPGGLDFSVGGHVQSGESYEQTMIRELQEEAGLIIAVESLEFIADIPATGRHITRLFLLRSDRQPVLSDEHTGGSWLTPDELQTKLEAGIAAKESLLPKLLLLKKYLGND